MGWRRMVVGLTAKQRRELERLVTRADESAPVVRRAHVALWSADGVAGAAGARRLRLSAGGGGRGLSPVLVRGVRGLPPRAQGRGHGERGPPAAGGTLVGVGLC